MPLYDAKLDHEDAALPPGPNDRLNDLRPLRSMRLKLRYEFESMHGCSTAHSYISMSRGAL